MGLTHVQGCLGHLVCHGLGSIGQVLPDFCILHKLDLPGQGAGPRAHIGYLQQDPHIQSVQSYVCSVECHSGKLAKKFGPRAHRQVIRLSSASQQVCYGMKAQQPAGK